MKHSVPYINTRIKFIYKHQNCKSENIYYTNNTKKYGRMLLKRNGYEIHKKITPSKRKVVCHVTSCSITVILIEPQIVPAD